MRLCKWLDWYDAVYKHADYYFLLCNILASQNSFDCAHSKPLTSDLFAGGLVW